MAIQYYSLINSYDSILTRDTILKHTERKTIIGLDIGSRFIKATELNTSGQVSWFAVREINPMVYHNGEIINRGELVGTLEEMLSSKKPSKIGIAVFIPAQFIQIKTTNLPVEGNDPIVSEVDIKYNFIFNKDDNVLVGKTIIERPEGKDHAKVLLAISVENIVTELSTLIDEAGFHPSVVSSPAFTLPEIIPVLAVRNSTVLFLNIGNERTDLFLYKNTVLHGMRSNASGLSMLQQSDAGDFQTENHDKIAEIYPEGNLGFGSSEWIDLLDEIVGSIEGLLRDFKVSDNGLSALVIGGGGALRKDLISFLQKKFEGRFEVLTTGPELDDKLTNEINVPRELFCFSAAMSVWEFS